MQDVHMVAHYNSIPPLNTELPFLHFPLSFTLHSICTTFWSFSLLCSPDPIFSLPNKLPHPTDPTLFQGKRRIKNNFLSSLPFHEEIIISSVNFIVGHLFSFVFLPLFQPRKNIPLQRLSRIANAVIRQQHLLLSGQLNSSLWIRELRRYRLRSQFFFQSHYYAEN